MVNPFAISWLWCGFRGKSVAFALLFASAVLGISLSHWVKVGLGRLGVYWLFGLILPVAFFGWLSKREDRLIPDESKRKFYTRSLIAGSVALITWISR